MKNAMKILTVASVLALLGPREMANAGTFGIVKPDLTITSAGALTPTTGWVVVRNNGFVKAGACTVSMYVAGSSSIVTVSIPAMAANTSRYVTLTGSAILTKPGQQTRFMVDATFVVSETNESNNIRYWFSPPA